MREAHFVKLYQLNFLQLKAWSFFAQGFQFPQHTYVTRVAAKKRQVGKNTYQPFQGQ